MTFSILPIAGHTPLDVLMRKVRVQTQGVEYRTVARVVSLENLSAQWRPELRFLVRAADARAVTKIAQLRSAGLANLILLIPNRDAAGQWQAARQHHRA